MAKDPAVLFYTSDFLTGTILMTNEQKGKYITLLCLQHQKTVLSEKDILNICQSYDKDIFDKFIKSDEGYYNKRMRNEHEKRSNFSKSRSENRLKGIENSKTKKKKKKNSSYDNHMENENENILLLFNKFRVAYPGTKNGNETEFKNFSKKHSDWSEVLKLLLPSLENQIKVRATKKINNEFTPEWKNLQTWINKRCWEQETTIEKLTIVKKQTEAPDYASFKNID
jgi:hypothetical protein